MRNLKFLGMSFLLAMTAATSGVAQNPIIQTKYTADPAPMVYNDTVFLYTTHDEDDADEREHRGKGRGLQELNEKARAVKAR